MQFRRGIKPSAVYGGRSYCLRAVQFRRGIKQYQSVLVQKSGLRAVQFRRGIKHIIIVTSWEQFESGAIS